MTLINNLIIGAVVVFILFNVIPDQIIGRRDVVWAGEEFRIGIRGDVEIEENGYIVHDNSKIEAEGFNINPNEDFRIEIEFDITGELISGKFSEVSISFEDNSGNEGQGIAQIGSRFNKKTPSKLGEYMATSLVLEKKGDVYTYSDSTGQSFILPEGQFKELNLDDMWHFCMYGEVDGKGFVRLEIKEITIT